MIVCLFVFDGTSNTIESLKVGTYIECGVSIALRADSDALPEGQGGYGVEVYCLSECGQYMMCPDTGVSFCRFFYDICTFWGGGGLPGSPFAFVILLHSQSERAKLSTS